VRLAYYNPKNKKNKKSKKTKNKKKATVYIMSFFSCFLKIEVL